MSEEFDDIQNEGLVELGEEVELEGEDAELTEDAEASGKFSRLCPSFVELSASILQDYLEELGKLEKDAWK